jgi:V/A-type H+-transporting ATPase subunit B
MYLTIADRFEKEFIAQGKQEKRSVTETLDIGWKLFSALPEEDLKLISENLIKKYLPKYAEENKK